VVRIWKIPDQVIRLAVLFAIAGVALLVVRSMLVPKSFGEIGHYRADAVDAIAAQDIKYGGWQLCVECHDTEGEIKAASYHRSLACEVCHGPSYRHATEDPEIEPQMPRKRGEACLYCHSYLASRPTGFPQIIERLHNPLKPCISCHNPHDPTPPETPSACSACHAQIARTKAISHHASLDCETCHDAEPEHRENPRAHLPKKPTTNEFCGQCHAKGADSPAEIPRVDIASHGGRNLCWQCHYPHFPEGS
jgi:hypothetical protein